MKKILLISVLLFTAFSFFSCKTLDPIEQANQDFLDNSDNETFRVVMMSDSYQVRQLAYTKSMSREEDGSGDQYFMERMKKMDLIDAAREGHIKVWVYPDSGRLMKVRFLESTYIQELDQLIIDDIQRWSFDYTGSVYPLVFSVRYRMVLRSTLSDDEAKAQVEKLSD